MSKQNSTLGGVIFTLLVWLFIIGCYIGNVVKIIRCDFDSSKSWKGEIVHAIGLIGPLAVITIWNNDK